MTDKLKTEREIKKIFEIIWDNYWWKVRGFGYRINHGEDEERELLALAIKPYLAGELGK